MSTGQSWIAGYIFQQWTGGYTLFHQEKSDLYRSGITAYYQQQTDFPIIERLLADDAPQFKLLTLYLALCWIHDARHYKKLKPCMFVLQG